MTPCENDHTCKNNAFQNFPSCLCDFCAKNSPCSEVMLVQKSHSAKLSPLVQKWHPPVSQALKTILTCHTSSLILDYINSSSLVFCLSSPNEYGSNFRLSYGLSMIFERCNLVLILGKHLSFDEDNLKCR